MKVLFTKEAERDLTQLSQEVASRIVAKLLWLAANFHTQTPELLSGRFRGLFKLRVGPWRAVYEIDYRGGRLIVHLVDHRGRIYSRRAPKRITI